jgi:predicted nuclease of restriction endonuclease-like (RecB) superfamily
MKQSKKLLQDTQQIIEHSQSFAYRAVNVAMVQRNWLLGKRIAEEELRGKSRAKYGAEVIKYLAVELTKIYGKGFDVSTLYKFVDFYKKFPNILDSLSPKLQIQKVDSLSPKSKSQKVDSLSPKLQIQKVDSLSPKSKSQKVDSLSPKLQIQKVDSLSPKLEVQKVDSLSPKSFSFLTWTHYRTLLQVEDSDAREWYAHEAATETWSVRTLQRNISSQYYFRLLKSHRKKLVKQEMQQLTSTFQQDKLEFIKNPLITEFLGFTANSDFTESELEKNIIDNLQKFMMELGKGFAFVARQQHIRTEKQDYFVDLVFYNYILKCFVLIDLKTSKITHQDIGQMDMYIRMYDELKRSKGDSPTIGILLCADTDEDIAQFSILHGNEQLFATKYKTYMPTEEELRNEIETQKRMFYLQQKEKLTYRKK